MTVSISTGSEARLIDLNSNSSWLSVARLSIDSVPIEISFRTGPS